jgi:hypothetical protein
MLMVAPTGTHIDMFRGCVLQLAVSPIVHFTLRPRQLAPVSCADRVRNDACGCVRPGCACGVLVQKNYTNISVVHRLHIVLIQSWCTVHQSSTTTHQTTEAQSASPHLTNSRDPRRSSLSLQQSTRHAVTHPLPDRRSRLPPFLNLTVRHILPMPDTATESLRGSPRRGSAAGFMLSAPHSADQCAAPRGKGTGPGR